MPVFKNAFSYVEALSTVLSVPLLLSYIYKISQNSVSLPVGIPVLLFSLILGYLTADFLSGIAHWLLDRYGQLETPIFGPVILFFRVHHLFPKQMTMHNFFEVIGSTCFVVNIPLFLFILLSHPIGGSSFLLFANGFVLSCGFWLMATNYIHKMVHVDRPPKIFKLLQKFKIVLSPKGHSLHHTAPFETSYCITSGWCNPYLAKIRFFERLERAIDRLTGIKAGQYELSEIREKMVKMLNDYNHKSGSP